MNMKISIGQYYPTSSHIHQLDPRVKLMAVFAYITMLFLVNSLYGYGLALAALAVVIYASLIPFGMLLRGLRSVLFIVAFTILLNVFFTPGETVFFEYGIIHISREGFFTAGRMALRIVMLIIASSLLTLTTTPIALTDAIEYYLKPFRKIGVPAQEIAMMMTIALRFIPTLMEEMDKIMKAQIARGADFDTGGLIKKAKALIPLLVPLFVSSFRRAEELAMAMEARCYRTDTQRSKMKELKLRGRDKRAILYIILFILIMVGLRLMRG